MKTKADIYFVKIAEAIKNGSYSKNTGFPVRTVYNDNTPAHYYYRPPIALIYNLLEGELPILTLRHTAWKSGIKEMMWIYQDQSNDLDLLKDKYNITWWDNWDIGDRTIGQRYGATVKKYDLMNKLLDGLKNNPLSRRHIMNLYQETDLEATDGLYPCAMETQWSVGEGGYLDMVLIQRSSDVGVAWSINEMQYVALMYMVARHTGLIPRQFMHVITNPHIYDRHLDSINIMLDRFSNNFEAETTKLYFKLNEDKKDFYSFTVKDFSIVNELGEEVTFEKDNLTFELAI